MPESTGVYHVETHIYNHSTPRGHPCGGCIKGHTPRGTHQIDRFMYKCFVVRKYSNIFP